MDDKKCGYLYIATGDKYIREAAISVKSLRKVDKKAHITLVTNKKLEISLSSLFDEIKICPDSSNKWHGGLAYKVKHIYRDSPYENTFFIDTDTYFYESCRELFELLDYFDICMANAPVSIDAYINKKLVKGLTTYNTGVILYRKNKINERLFEKWYEFYEIDLREGTVKIDGDQTPFMEAFAKSESKVHILSNVWNARIPYYINLTGSVKIAHGRYGSYESNYEKLRARINKSTDNRCWHPMQARCFYGRKPSTLSKLKKALKKLLIPRQSQ